VNTALLFVGFGLFFTGEVVLIVLGMMKLLGYQPEPRTPRPKGPVARVSFREVTESLRQFRNLSRKD
jgi:hypothetical protein